MNSFAEVRKRNILRPSRKQKRTRYKNVLLAIKLKRFMPHQQYSRHEMVAIRIKKLYENIYAAKEFQSEKNVCLNIQRIYLSTLVS